MIKDPDINDQISDFVRRIFQDKRGDFWFGTNGDGVIRYDGNSLEYFSLRQGFGGYAVRGIVGDEDGNVWFGTVKGITKYNPHLKPPSVMEPLTHITDLRVNYEP